LGFIGKTGNVKKNTFVLDEGTETYYTEKEQNISKLSGLTGMFPARKERLLWNLFIRPMN
jgi:hypothetical protein